ncbi:hypothetical protein BV25DRAFT_1898247, partial [Artomyces pyxidatus]
PSCTPIINALNACTTATCTCSAAHVSALDVCVNCVVGTSPTELHIVEGQSYLDTFQQTCDLWGIPVFGLTITVLPASTATGTAGVFSQFTSSAPGSTNTLSVLPTAVSTFATAAPVNTPTGTSTGGGGVTISVPDNGGGGVTPTTPTTPIKGPGLAGGAAVHDVWHGALVAGFIAGTVAVFLC